MSNGTDVFVTYLDKNVAFLYFNYGFSETKQESGRLAQR